MRAKMESDEVLTWTIDAYTSIRRAMAGQCRSRAVRTGGQMRPTGPTWALKVGAMTATRRLASGQMLGNREIAQ